MPIDARYVFIAGMDVDADKEAIFNEVYDTEARSSPAACSGSSLGDPDDGQSRLR